MASGMASCKIPLVTSVAIRLLHQTHGWKICQIARKYPNFARRSISRHAKLKIPTDDSPPVFDRRKNNPGRPSIVKERDERRLLRTIQTLRNQVGNTFTSGQIKEEAGLSHVSNRTVRHYLNKNNFYFRHLRKKGLLTAKDRKNRVKFARKLINRLYSSEFWTEGISFYLDGVGFVHKCNPNYAARTNSNMAYRLKNEGLEMTAKGRKEGRRKWENG